MKFRKVKKVLTVFLLGVTILIGGCSAQSTPSTTAASIPTTTPTPLNTTVAPTPTLSLKPSAAGTTTVSSPAATATAAAAATRKTYTAPPSMQIDKSKKYYATLNTTLGNFKVELFTSESPLTVNNFVVLSRDGFYNGIIFHRIMKTFMIQTGDPKGTGMGGPGYKFADELPPKHSYTAGIVAMANSGPNTNGSQFFICTVDNSKSLGPAYTQFGQVVEGMDVVQQIASVKVTASASGEMSKPATPPVINSIAITEE